MEKKKMKKKRLTDEGNAQRAKHEEQKQHVQANLFVVSKYCVESFPIVAKLFAALNDDQRISILKTLQFLNPTNFLLLLSFSLSLLFVHKLHLLSTGIALKLFQVRVKRKIWLTPNLLPAQNNSPLLAFVDDIVCISAPPIIYNL